MQLRTGFVFFCLLLSVSLAMGQVQTGTITGTVLDPRENVVPDAKVTVRDMETGTVYTATSDNAGTFTVPGLPFGMYVVTIEVSGFRKWESNNVRVITAQEAIIKAHLEIGPLNEVVTVEASQAVINTVSAELTTDVSRRQILDLPLPTRNPMDLVSLQAGVTGGTGTRTSVFNGLRGNTNNITQDGINVQDNFIRSDGFFADSAPTVENTGEFSISSQNIGSDSGAGVGQVRITTQRGSNDLHGSVFYFHRNDALNANTWTNNSTGTKKDKLRQHRFGGNVGGPVYFPGLYNGHEKSFFFFRYEGFRESFQQTRNRTVLTQAARTGMFSYTDSTGATRTVNLLTAGPRGLPINPFTKSLIDAMPLPNNTLVGDGLNTGGVRFNASGKDPDNRYTIRIDHKAIESKRFGTHWVEVDWNWTKFTTFPDTFNNNDAVFPPGVAVNCTAGVCLGAGQSSFRKVLSVAINSTLSSSMFNEFRSGFSRAPVTFAREADFPRAFQVTFPAASTLSSPERNFLNQGRITPIYQFSDNFTKVWRGHTFRSGFLISSTSGNTFNDASLLPVLALGSNTFNSDGLSASSLPGLPNTTEGTNTLNRARGIYQVLVGMVNTDTQRFNGTPGVGFVPGATNKNFLRERAYNLYFEDSWRWRPKLTLNYGLRYELVPAVDQINKRAISPTNFQSDLFFSGPLFQVNPNVTFNDIRTGRVPTTKLTPAGASNGVPFWETDKNNFGPFVGIAWQPISKTVIRSGFSVNYTRDGLNVVSNAIAGNTGLVTDVQTLGNAPGGASALASSSGDFSQAIPTLSFPIDQLTNFVSTSGSSVLFTFDRNLRTPYVLQWSFGVQRELWPSTALEVRYVGNHAVKLIRGIDVGQLNLTPALVTEFNNAKANLACRGGMTFSPQGACNAPTPTLTAMQIPATFFTNSTLISNLKNDTAGDFWFTIQNNCTLFFLANNGTVCPGLGGLPANQFVANPLALASDVIGNGSSSIYHSLQLEVRRTLTRSLLFQANYTLGKVLTDSSGGSTEFESLLDLNNPRFDRTRATFDIRHTFHFNGVWEIPVGRGRRWASSGVLGKVLEGWQTGSLWTWRSGRPTSILSDRATLNRGARSTGKNSAVPVGLSAVDVCSVAGVNRTSNGAFFLPEQFFVRASTGSGTTGATSLLANPGAGSVGDHSLYLGCSGPRFFQLDMNFVKKTHITERLNFEFRAEFFNIFNHPNFLAPQGTVGSTTGNIGSNINNPGFAVLDGNTFTPREIQFNFRINW